MGASRADVSHWLMEIQEVLNADEAAQVTARCSISIFTIPAPLRVERPEAYVPTFVSLGPYHHLTFQLLQSETYKSVLAIRAQNSSGGRLFRSVVERIISRGDEIRESYDQPIACNNEALGWMMGRDALFLLEYFLCDYNSEDRCNIISKPAFEHLNEVFDSERRSPLSYILQADILKLENQVPLFLLVTVFSWQTGESEAAAWKKLRTILKRACSEFSPFLGIGRVVQRRRRGSHRLPHHPHAACSHFLLHFPSVCFSRPMVAGSTITRHDSFAASFNRFARSRSDTPRNEPESSTTEPLVARTRELVVDAGTRSSPSASDPMVAPSSGRALAGPDDYTSSDPIVAATDDCPRPMVHPGHEIPERHVLEFLYKWIVRPRHRSDGQRETDESNDSEVAPDETLGFLQALFYNVLLVHFVVYLLIAKVLWPARHSEDEIDTNLPSAVALRKKGVKFARTAGIGSIRFDKISCTLFLPAIRVDDRTEVVLRNLVALEAFMKLETRPLASYADLMDQLVDSASDVALLKRHGIIHSRMGTDKEVANAINGIGRSMWKGEYEPIDTAVQRVKDHCKSSMRVLFAEFLQEYFSKPWRVVSVLAASILLALTSIQTYCSLEQLRLQRKSTQ